MDLVFDYFDEHGLLEINNIYNVNVPENNKGILITRQGGPYYSDEFEPRENDLFMPIGKRVYEEKTTDELDTDAVIQIGVSHIVDDPAVKRLLGYCRLFCRRRRFGNIQRYRNALVRGFFRGGICT